MACWVLFDPDTCLDNPNTLIFDAVFMAMVLVIETALYWPSTELFQLALEKSRTGKRTSSEMFFATIVKVAAGAILASPRSL
ncbi:hypothetical protein BTUL_0153g00220 [Botrytis tulipae]|uniref:Uncharacterized protein n=1 Tax=Botrytis tulipae TaxID=87230 RepID=A0A4Z1EC71_9HELO|nr:hypothetical protein BTUL_0153g00220 [Botrytis tulipae]